MDDRFKEILMRHHGERPAGERPKVITGSFGVKGEDRFYAVASGEHEPEIFLEVRLRDGFTTCFQYWNITWMAFEPEYGISIDFSGFSVCIKGKGLGGKFFELLKRRKISWVKEAESDEMPASDDLFISNIMISPPDKPFV